MKSNKLIKYWPLVLGVITLIFFLSSIKFTGDYNKLAIDHLTRVVEDQLVSKLADHETRISVLEATK